MKPDKEPKEGYEWIDKNAHDRSIFVKGMVKAGKPKEAKKLSYDVYPEDWVQRKIPRSETTRVNKILNAGSRLIEAGVPAPNVAQSIQGTFEGYYSYIPNEKSNGEIQRYNGKVIYRWVKSDSSSDMTEKDIQKEISQKLDVDS